VLLMLERLVNYWLLHDGVSFATFEQDAAAFRERHPFPGQP
jgi:hypothetical protein